MRGQEEPRRNQTSRWWLNSSLARLAFGPDTGRDGAGKTAMEEVLAEARMGDYDLRDPARREFGDYELLELIGQGGMGIVFRARQRSLDREVALKLLSAGPWASAELVDNLRREAHNAAVLHHPNIVVVHEMGEHDGQIFYAMQLVQGRSLAQCLAEDGPFGPEAAATLLRQVAEAVDYAHRLNVLHLDLKPGNILIDAQGEPLIADFGLARPLEHERKNEQISGTPSYMAPEQAQAGGPPLAPSTDVWALGAVLYEMLTGQPPFDQGDPAATLKLLKEGQVRRPSRLRPIPADLEAICLTCLDKDPARRYPNARALADDLGRYLEGRMVSVRPLNATQRLLRWSSRDPALALALGGVVLALVLAVLASWL